MRNGGQNLTHQIRYYQYAKQIELEVKDGSGSGSTSEEQLLLPSNTG